VVRGEGGEATGSVAWADLPEEFREGLFDLYAESFGSLGGRIVNPSLFEQAEELRLSLGAPKSRVFHSFLESDAERFHRYWETLPERFTPEEGILLGRPWVLEFFRVSAPAVYATGDGSIVKGLKGHGVVLPSRQPLKEEEGFFPERVRLTDFRRKQGPKLAAGHLKAALHYLDREGSLALQSAQEAVTRVDYARRQLGNPSGLRDAFLVLARLEMLGVEQA
jgi:hypothetical protein